MNPNKTILVDSDAFISLLKQNDSNHKKAESIFQKLEKTTVSFFTSNYVFVEAITVISQKINHHVAVDFINNTKSPNSLFTVEWINEEIENLAIQFFKKQTSKNVSFVDCTNMALMTYLNLDAIFSFDKIYPKNGFKLVS